MVAHNRKNWPCAIGVEGVVFPLSDVSAALVGGK